VLFNSQKADVYRACHAHCEQAWLIWRQAWASGHGYAHAHGVKVHLMCNNWLEHMIFMSVAAGSMSALDATLIQSSTLGILVDPVGG
tara:strand:- start:661 stop:921 length:261 start_codon:yes stop_codon:yes gene_type:complete